MARRVVGLAVVLAIAWGGMAAAMALDLTPRLGLDLQGGTSVVLTAPEGTDPELIDVSIGIMNNRIEDFGGVQEPDITRSGDDTVVVQLPGVEDEQRAIEAVGQTGELSFRPVLESLPADTPLTQPDDINAEAFLRYEPAEGLIEVLHVGPARLEGEHVAEASPVPPGLQGPGAAVNLVLTEEGGDLFAEMTREAATYPPGDPRRFGLPRWRDRQAPGGGRLRGGPQGRRRVPRHPGPRGLLAGDDGRRPARATGT